MTSPRRRQNDLRSVCAPMPTNRTRLKMILPAKARGAGGVPLRQLKLNLRWSNPPIGWRVVLRADMLLDLLHHVIWNFNPAAGEPILSGRHPFWEWNPDFPSRVHRLHSVA